MNEHDDDQVLEGPVNSAIDGSVALEAVDRASIDMQIATANKYPRSVTDSLREAEGLATMDPETAATMFYTLPRGGKKIEGPSVRLAEIMAYTWGNLRVDADIVGDDGKQITAMGTCFDLQKNVAIRVRVMRRVTNNQGVRFNDDMVGVTMNAAVSIALRNCIFKTVPASLVRRIYLKARRASVGEGTLKQKRDRCWEALEALDVTKEQIFTVLKVKGWDDVGIEQLITLHGLKTAIEEGDTTVAEAFAPESSEGRSDATDELRQAAERRAKAGKGKEQGKTGTGTGSDDTDDSGEPGDPKASSGGSTDAKQGGKGSGKGKKGAGETPESPSDASNGSGEDEGDTDDSESQDGPETETTDEDEGPNPGADIPTTREGITTAIEQGEALCELKGGARTRKRRRFAGDSDLANCEMPELQEYYAHLLALAE